MDYIHNMEGKNAFNKPLLLEFLSWFIRLESI